MPEREVSPSHETENNGIEVKLFLSRLPESYFKEYLANSTLRPINDSELQNIINDSSDKYSSEQQQAARAELERRLTYFKLRELCDRLEVFVTKPIKLSSRQQEVLTGMIRSECGAHKDPECAQRIAQMDFIIIFQNLER